MESTRPRAEATELRPLVVYMAAAYGELRPSSELETRATVTLLTSLVLIGLSLASQKPDTVQVLGFTLQTDHWLLLACPLALVVVYATTQLYFAWDIERHRLRYSLHGPIESVRAELARIQQQCLDRVAGFREESAHMSKKREDIWAVYEPKLLSLVDREAEVFESVSVADYEERLEELRKEREKVERHLEQRLKREGVTDFDREVRDFLKRRFVDGIPEFEEVLAQTILNNMKRISRIKKARATLGFYVPLVVAGLALITLVFAAAFPSWLSGAG